MPHRKMLQLSLKQPQRKGHPLSSTLYRQLVLPVVVLLGHPQPLGYLVFLDLLQATHNAIAPKLHWQRGKVKVLLGVRTKPT